MRRWYHHPRFGPAEFRDVGGELVAQVGDVTLTSDEATWRVCQRVWPRSFIETADDDEPQCSCHPRAEAS